MQVRARALQVMFMILHTHGRKFSPPTWQMIFRGVSARPVRAVTGSRAVTGWLFVRSRARVDLWCLCIFAGAVPYFRRCSSRPEQPIDGCRCAQRRSHERNDCLTWIAYVLCVYVCVCICVCVCARLCVRVYLCVSMYVIYLSIHPSIYLLLFNYLHIYPSICISVCVHVRNVCRCTALSLII